MVSQKMVQEVMEKLNRPCTPKDIEKYMRENNICNIPSDFSYDISGVLNSLRRWEVVDKYPDFHGRDSKKWYLRSANPHDPKNCEYCTGIKIAHTNNTYMHMMQSYSRKIRKVTDKDHLANNEFEITTRDW